MKYLFFLLSLGLSLTTSAQTFQQNYIQYSSTGVGSGAGADVIDYDGDGKQDVLIGFYSRRELLFLKNNEVNYTPTVISDSVMGYSYIKTLDFDNDGFDDFLLQSKETGSLSHNLYLFKNDGNYNYNPILVTPMGFDEIESLEVGDLDGDGDLDIVFDLIANDNWLRVHENLGDTAFNFWPGAISFSGQPCSLYGLADMNNDNVLDVVGAYYDFGPNDPIVVVMENDNSFGFTQHDIVQLDDFPTIAIGEFSSGGSPDLILSPVSGSVQSTLLRNDGNFNFTQVAQIATQNWATLGMTLDYDSDGDDDFISFGFTGGNSVMTVLLNSGGNNFTSQTLITEGIGYPMAWKDMDNDGQRDFVLRSNTSSRLEVYRKVSGNTHERQYINFSEGITPLVVADVDGNGNSDIAVTGGNQLNLFKQRFDEQMDVFKTHAIGGGISSSQTRDMIAYDRDNDGDEELLCRVGFKLYWVDHENGAFSEELVTDDANVQTVRVGDLDNDNLHDILLIGNPIQRFEWNGSGYTETAISANMVYPVLDDVDGDLDVDIVYMHFTQELRLLRNNGNSFVDELIMDISTFVGSSTTSNQNDTEFAGFDIDEDGDTDLFVLSEAEDKLVWFRNDGGLSYTGFTISTALDNPDNFDFGDMDGDLDMDIVVTNTNDQELVQFTNDGSENFTQEVIWDEVSYPREIAAKDFDNDGDIDIQVTAGDYKIYWLENLLVDCSRTFSASSDTVCPGDSVLFGTNFVSAIGFYRDTTINGNNCDSIIGFDLGHYPLPTLSISAINLIANGTTGLNNYQWYLDGMALAGETTSSINAEDHETGDYYLEATSTDGCLLISNTLFLELPPDTIDTIIGVPETEWAANIRTFPNPTSGLLTIEVEQVKAQELSVALYSLDGRRIPLAVPVRQQGAIVLDLGHVAPGLLLLEIRSDQGVIRQRIVKQ